MREDNSDSINKLAACLEQLLSEFRSEIQELKERVDKIEGRPPPDTTLTTNRLDDAYSPIPEIIVVFPNGDRIAEESAMKTVEKTIERIGIERVYGVKIMARKKKKIPLIEKYNSHGDKQRRLGSYWIWTFATNSETKGKWLRDISIDLNLDLKIDVNIKPRVNENGLRNH